ncbi:unnamed protein product, partial [Hapterophycus canaliculatus]
RHQPPQTSVLTVRGVESASLDQAGVWASAPDVIWALLAAACRPGGDGSSRLAENQAGRSEESASCAEARRAACTLLERLFGNGMGEEASGEETEVMGGEKATKAIDQWYKGFRAVTAPFGSEGEGGGSRQGRISCLVVHEAPRLLLKGMLKIPAVKRGFVGRGLTTHLAEVLRTALAETKEIENMHEHHRLGACPRGGTALTRGVAEPLTNEAGSSSSCPRTDERDLRHEKHDTDDSHISSRANPRRLPWWLLFSHHEPEPTRGHEHEDKQKHGHGSDDAAITGGSADGRSASEIDGRSCTTTLDEISAAGGETKGVEPDTGKAFDSLSARDHDDGHDDATGDDSLASATTGPASTTADQREYRERGGAARRRNVGKTSSSTKERVSPPLLRLDALDSILDTKEWTSPQHCSSHAAVVLSAASTRAAPEHMVCYALPYRDELVLLPLECRPRILQGRTRRKNESAEWCFRDRFEQTAPLREFVAADIRSVTIRDFSPRRYPRRSAPCPDLTSAISFGEVLCSCLLADGWRDDVSNSPGQSYRSRGALKGVDRQKLQSCMSFCTRFPTSSCHAPCPPPQPTFLSARGSTSRASARHGSGRSARTGRTTQRDTTSSRDSPVSEGVRHSVDPEPGVPHLTRLPSTVANQEVAAVLHNYGAAVKGGSRDHGDIYTSEHAYRRTGTVMSDGDANDVAVHSPAKDRGDCSRTPIDCPANLLLSLARDSARGRASSSPLRGPEKHLKDVRVLFDGRVSVARLLVSLLPSTPITHIPEDSLVAALDVLSLAGARLWINEGARESFCSGPEVGRVRNAISGAGQESSLNIWASEFERVDIALLAQAGQAILDLRISSLRSESQTGCRDGEEDKGVASASRRSRVYKACLMGVECVWLTHLLLRRVITASALDDEWRSAIPPEEAAGAVRFCGRALEMLSRSLHSLCSSHSPRLCAASDGGQPGEDSQGLSKDFPEVSLENTGHAAEFLLLTAPMVVDLAELLALLMEKPTLWSENPDWAVETLSLATFYPNGAAVPALVDLLRCLVGSVPTGDGNDHQGASVQEGSHRRKPCISRALREAAEHLEMDLGGGSAVFQQLFTAVLHSVATILCRARTLLKTSYDRSQDTADTAEPHSGPIHKARMEIRKAVSRVWMETSPIFRQEGPVLAILQARLPPTSGDKDEGDPTATVPRGASPVSSVTSAASLAATLRLSKAFLTLSLNVAVGDEDELRGLECFVAPLFSGYRERWDGMAGRLKAELDDTGRQPSEEKRVARHGFMQESNGALRLQGTWEVLLCRLHLEALVEIAHIPDPNVQLQLRECNVAPFLLQHLLAIDGGGASTPDEVLESPRTVHGSLIYSSSCGALTSHESPPSNTAGCLPAGNGSGAISSKVQTGNLRKSEPGSSGGNQFEAAAQLNGATSAIVADGVKYFSAGDRIDALVCVKNGRPRWFPGRVESVHEEDGTLHVCYDDGDEEARKDPRKVRPHRTRTVDRRPGSRIQNRSRGAEGTVAVTTPAPFPTVLRRNQDGRDMATTSKRLIPGGLVLGSSITDIAHSRPDVISAARSKKWVSTGDLVVSTKFSSSGGDTSSPGPVVDAADDGDSTADDDRKDDDAYFEIPTVFDAMSAADNTNCPLPADDPVRLSVVPRIDLQSPVFRTRVFSSQLGPGSSLSTPTTGGARVLDTFRTGRASRSETSLAIAVLPSGRSSRASRRPSLTGRPSAGSGSPSSRGFQRSASVLSDYHQSVADGGGLGREIARLLDRKPHLWSKEEKDEEDDDEIVSSTSGIARSARSSSGCAQEVDEGDEDDAAVGASGARRAVPQLGNDDKPIGLHRGHQLFSVARHRWESYLRVMQGCAVAVVLAIATSPAAHDSPLTSVEAPGEETTSIPGVMAALERVFDGRRSAQIIPGLKVRWCSGAMSPAAPPAAVMAKLVCAELFDARSYSLDGDHVAAGRFGGVIVSKSPLPLGGTRASLTFDQAPLDPPPSRRTREEHGHPAEPLEWPLPHDPHRRRLREDSVSVGNEVALKVVEREDFDGATGLAVFGEVLALRALAGVPGVCRLYDFGVTRVSYVLVIERCACSLKDWRLARGVHSGGEGDNGGDDDVIEVYGDRASPEAPCSDEEVALYLCVFRQVVSAVAAMAERGVIHCDLKCENILVRSSGNPYGNAAFPATSAGLRKVLIAGQQIVPSICVADFGEAVIGRRNRPWQRHRQPGIDPVAKGGEEPTAGRASCDQFCFDVRGARGTERIQSPEMILLAGASRSAGGARGHRFSVARGHGQEPVGTITAASDVWSLGCLLYELLSKKLLFGDLEWSEFFVMLTAGQVATSQDDDGTMKAAPATPMPVFPSPQTLMPFATLGSTETLRRLLEAMLVRDPADRPGASRVVRYVDEALEAVVSSSLKIVTESDKEPQTNEPCSDKRMSSYFTPPNGSALSNVRGETAELRANVADVPRREHAALDDPSVRRGPGRTPNGAGKPITFENAYTDWTLLRPSSAVGAHHNLAVKRFALQRCDGIINRLGAGSYLLALDSSTKGCRVETNDAAAAWHRLRPETMVCCDTAAGCEDFCCIANGPPSSMAATGLPRCSLGNALSALGVSHVVCVMSKQGGAEDVQHRSSAMEHNPSHLSHHTDSPVSQGPRLLKVHVPIGDDEQEENSPDSKSSAPPSVKGMVRDVLEFATGQRVIFVGVDSGRDVAGAVAVAWAMNRTGMGPYETMLKFRQEFAGFWVDLAILKAVIG